MYPGDVAHILGDLIVGVFDFRVILVGDVRQHVRSLEHIQAGLSDVLRDLAGSDGLSIDALERFEGLVSQALLLDAVHYAIALEVANRGHGNACHRHRPRQTHTDVHAGQNVLRVRVQLPDSLAQPALVADPVRLGRVPDVHAPEVGAIGVRVADALDDGHLSLVVQTLEGCGVGIHRQLIVDGQDIVLAHHNFLAGVVIVLVGVGHYGVHEVVAAGKLNNYQRLFPALGGHILPHALSASFSYRLCKLVINGRGGHLKKVVDAH